MESFLKTEFSCRIGKDVTRLVEMFLDTTSVDSCIISIAAVCPRECACHKVKYNRVHEPLMNFRFYFNQFGYITEIGRYSITHPIERTLDNEAARMYYRSVLHPHKVIHLDSLHNYLLDRTGGTSIYSYISKPNVPLEMFGIQLYETILQNKYTEICTAIEVYMYYYDGRQDVVVKEPIEPIVKWSPSHVAKHASFDQVLKRAYPKYKH